MKNIVITGFMGTGKSTVGKMLAEDYGLDFVDTDELIEKKAGGKRISEIFEESGEAYFRKIENDIIRDVSLRENTVISTGGGAIADKENLALLKRKSIIICLTARPEVILERIRKEEGIRPLLKVEDPLKRIKELLDSRREAYMRSDIIIDTSDLTPGEAAKKIKIILKEKGIAKD
ncbi:MAG: shikimate kinase [Nitrospirae bacterium]|nr:shikimate kinase [Nitrospirota bacterium]